MNKKLIIIIAAVVLLLVVVGGVVVVFVLGGDGKEPVIVYSEYSLDEAYSNLADEGGTKIIKYQVVIEYTDDAILTEIEKNKTKIVNNIDELMRAALSEDLMKTNGKEKMRQRIQDMVIETLESDEEVISNIYIAPFIIQG
jgi:flagellar basal body-associated protein FliL